MSKDPEDLELEALQRRLDDAFATTRPRRGFEDELWLRMQRRRPFGARVRDFFGGMVDGIREAPAVPAGVAALVLIVAVGVGVVGPYLAARPHSIYSSTAAPNAGGADRSSAWSGGKVPTPALHPGLVDSGAPVPATVQLAPGLAARSDVYFGPANLTWAGNFAASTVDAPVLIYAEPKSSSEAGPGQFGPEEGVTVTTRGSVAQLPREPVFTLTELSPGVAAGADPVEAATNLLQAHNALPAWQYSVAVVRSGDVTRVIFQRAFPAQGGQNAYLVDWNGERYGTEVDIVNGRRTAEGPVPLPLESVQLPLISNDQAAQMAVTQPPASTQALTPIPSVSLDRVELVYVLAVSGGNGFYEPAYLFSGTFTYNGQTYTKRVLVPLVVPSLRS
ncbi:MAG TPA: hypothetical protein VFB69_03465 [Candidatus Dormibacteraeota bacterium]|nr:hypothetical protein [Candidatus Dormibacteraeota bacterium]